MIDGEMMTMINMIFIIKAIMLILALIFVTVGIGSVIYDVHNGFKTNHSNLSFGCIVGLFIMSAILLAMSFIGV